MARIAKRAFLGNVPTSITDLATVPSGKKWEVVDITWSNGSGGTATVNIVGSDGTNAASLDFFSASPNNTHREVTLFHVLNAGDKLRGNANGASNVNCIITVIEVDV